MNEHELDLALGDIGAGRTRVTAPAALRGRVRAVPIQTTQQRSWLPLAGRFKSTFSATKLVVAGVIVALFGGLLLTGVLTTQPSDEQAPAAVSTAATEPDASEVASPTTQATNALESTTTSIPPIELPGEIPEDIESGTLKTPLGPARWVHLSGDAASLPPGLRGLISTPDGYIVPEWSSAGNTLWRSPDLLAWTRQPIGIQSEGGELTYTADGTYWLGSGDGLWRSKDMGSWEQVDLAGLIPQREGYAHALWVGIPLEQDGITIVPFTWGPSYGVLNRDLAQGAGARGLTEVEPGVYRLGHPDEGAPLLRFEEIEGGLRMIDHEEGTELKVLDGMSMEFVERLASDVGIPGGNGLAIIDGQGLAEVALPDEMRQNELLAFSTHGPGFTAFGLGDGLLTVYRSADGRDWRQTDVVGDDAGEPTGIEYFVPLTERPIRYPGEGTQWTTKDGQSWEELPRPARANPRRFASGWIQPTGRRSWFQPDGGEPVRLDLSEIPQEDSCGGGHDPISSNTLFHSCEGMGVRDTLIVTFGDVPAADLSGVYVQAREP